MGRLGSTSRPGLGSAPQTDPRRTGSLKSRRGGSAGWGERDGSVALGRRAERHGWPSGAPRAAPRASHDAGEPRASPDAGGERRLAGDKPAQGASVTPSGSRPGSPPVLSRISPDSPGQVTGLAGQVGQHPQPADPVGPQPVRHGQLLVGRDPDRPARPGAGPAGRGTAHSVEPGSARWSATLRAAASPAGSQGRAAVVNPAAGEPSHCIGVRARSRLPRAPVAPSVISSRCRSGGTVDVEHADLVAVVQHEVPGSVASSSRASRVRWSSPPHQRLGNRPTSWLDAIQTGHDPAGQAWPASAAPRRTGPSAVKVREHEREVERQLQLVVVAVVRGQLR